MVQAELHTYASTHVSQVNTTNSQVNTIDTAHELPLTSEHPQKNCRRKETNHCRPSELYSRAVAKERKQHQHTTMAADIPLLITSENSSSERRVTPSWTIAHLKGRLEPITGIPAGCQRLQLKVASQTPQAIEAVDEDVAQVQQWPLQPYAEIHVGDETVSCIKSTKDACWAQRAHFHATFCKDCLA